MKELFTFSVKKLTCRIKTHGDTGERLVWLLLLYAQFILTPSSSFIPELLTLAVFLLALYVGLYFF